MSEWTVAGVVRGHARDQADAPALTLGDNTLTWSELDERSSRVGRALLQAGVRAGDRVAFLDKNGIEYFETLFGAAKIGAVGVAVNWRLAPAEMQYIVNDAGAKVLVAGAEFRSHLDEMSPGLTTVGTTLVAGDPGPYESWEEWVSSAAPDDPGHTAAQGDVALQLYTSGTTGLPKGAMLTNANFGRLMDVAPHWRLDATSVSAVPMPLFHIGGSGWALAGMTMGAHTVVVREIVAEDLLDTMVERRVTNTFIVPAVLQMLTAVPGAADRDYSALRSIAYGASPITDAALLRSMRTFRCEFIQLYGLTETTGAITQLDPADHDPDGPRAALLRSAGRPYPWVEIQAVDPVTGERRGTGEVGELWSRSPQNMSGYWNKPEATAETITSDGWLKTGDAGFIDPDGYVFITDRIKDLIVSGGENIYPVEVENVLAAHPGVADVAVIGVPDARWGETVKALVVPQAGESVTGEELIAFCRERLAHFKCPTSVDFVELLPRNPSGKTLKRQLREPFWKGQDRRVH